MEKMWNIEVSEVMLDRAMGESLPMMAQHLVGGVMCAPAIFGLGVPRAAAVAMARHGALVELGWELQDTAVRLHERFFTAQGAKAQPNGLFFMLAMHHAMQWALVIPMNLYYSELSGYHELVFMLEGASGFAGAAMFYGYTLDTSRRSDLRRMIVLSALGLAVMVYTRFVHYWWSLYKCLRHFYLEGSYTMFVVGVACGCFMMPFIATTFVPQQWHKLAKFTRLYMAQGRCDRDAGELPALIKDLRQCGRLAPAPGKKHFD